MYLSTAVKTDPRQ